MTTRATPSAPGADGLTLFLFHGVALAPDPSGAADAGTESVPVGTKVQVDDPVDYIDPSGRRWYAFQLANGRDPGAVYWLDMTALQRRQQATPGRILFSRVVGDRSGVPPTVPSAYNGVSFVDTAGHSLPVGAAVIVSLNP